MAVQNGDFLLNGTSCHHMSPHTDFAITAICTNHPWKWGALTLPHLFLPGSAPGEAWKTQL